MSIALAAGALACEPRAPVATFGPPLGAELKIPSMTVLTATLTCPACGHKKAETMPTNACVHFYECTGCGTVVRPKVGDCCVFCSYGSSRCPPRQAEGA